MVPTVGPSTALVWLLIIVQSALAVVQVVQDQFPWAAVAATVLAALNNALRSFQAVYADESDSEA